MQKNKKPSPLKGVPRKQPERYKTNPFIDQLVIPVKKKQVRVTPLGKNSDVSIMNNETGEIQGTHVSTYRKVDADQFVKLFTANIAMTFELKSPGLKALNVLVWAVQEKGINRDEIELDKYVLEEFLEAQDRPLKLSQTTLVRGLQELEEAKIVARTMRMGRFYINPNFIFNGDRIAFTNIIEKKSPEEQQELPLS